jgi:hypothetical protein
MGLPTSSVNTRATLLPLSSVSKSDQKGPAGETLFGLSCSLGANDGDERSVQFERAARTCGFRQSQTRTPFLKAHEAPCNREFRRWEVDRVPRQAEHLASSKTEQSQQGDGGLPLCFAGRT